MCMYVCMCIYVMYGTLTLNLTPVYKGKRTEIFSNIRVEKTSSVNEKLRVFGWSDVGVNKIFVRCR